MANKSIDYTVIGIIAASAGLIMLYFMKKNDKAGNKLGMRKRRPAKKRTIESIKRELKSELKEETGKDNIKIDNTENVQDKKNDLAKESGQPPERPTINSGKNIGQTVGPRPKRMISDSSTETLSNGSPTKQLVL